MKNYFLLVLCLCLADANAQLLKAENSKITFFSDALLEDITATNTMSAALFDVSKGEFAFEVPIKEFQFDKDLMKQHFNEKYMETERYPKATFGGKLEGFDASKSSSQSVTALGKLTIHGVTREVKIPGTVEIAENKRALIKAKFIVKLEDFKIKIPSVVFQNIAEEVEVTVEFTMKP